MRSAAGEGQAVLVCVCGGGGGEEPMLRVGIIFDSFLLKLCIGEN